MQDEKQLIYVLNQYWANEASHFAHVGRLLEAIARRGVRVTLIIEKGDSAPNVSGGNVKVLHVPAAKRWRRFWLLVLMIRRAAMAGRNAVFVRIAIPAALASIIACLGGRARVFYWQSGTVHAADRESRRGLGKFLWIMTSWVPFRLVVNGCHRFVTGPESMLTYYRDEVRVPTGKLVLLYNDVDVEAFSDATRSCDRSSERAKLSVSCGEVVLLFVHRLSPVRRTMLYLPGILDVLRRNATAVAVFAGGGPELGQLRELVKNAGMGGRCRILGSVPHRDLPRLFAAADVFINPSRAEGFPRVILEAMAAGLPIVATDAGGTMDIVGPQQREFVIPAEELSRFSDAVHLMTVNATCRQRVAAENRVTVLRFDTNRVAGMYDRVLFG